MKVLSINEEVKKILEENKMPRWKLDVNSNETKKGIKIQFKVGEMDNIKKAEIGSKLKQKLNSGLSQYGLSVDEDRDVPYSDVVGFTIYLDQFKSIIKKILSGESQ